MSNLEAPSVSNTPQPSSLPGASPYLTLESLTRTLQALVRINSANPSYGGPSGGERRVQEWAAEFLRQLGIPAEFEETPDGRYNLRVRLAGRTEGLPLLLETHIDTVSIERMTIDPLAALVRDGRLWGRGATDAKGQAAAMLHAVAAWAAAGCRPERPVELVLACDEEQGFAGSKALLARGVRAAGIVIGEPTGMRIVTTHKGTIRVWIRVEGKSAHGARPHLGINAVVEAAALIQAIDTEYVPELAGRRAPLLDPPTVNIGVIEGGLQANLVPPICRIQLDRRLLPSETEAQFRAELEALLANLARRRPSFRAVLEPTSFQAPAVATDPAAPLVRLAGQVAAAHGFDPAPVGVDYATDAAILAASGVPVIIIGPGSIDQAHTADEFVELDQVLAGACYYADLIGRPL